MDISVIIPTYKETDRLNRTLKEISPYLENKFRSYEVIIVDDPDEQGNYTKLQPPYDKDQKIKFLRQHSRLGKGAAVRRGCLDGKGEIILFMDADHSTPIEELDQFLPQLNDRVPCMVSGARTYQDDESKWRRVIGLAAMLIFAHRTI